MKKFNSFAFYTLIAPAMTIAAGSVVAQQPVVRDIDQSQQSTQRDQGDTQSNPSTSQSSQGTSRDGQSNSVASQGSQVTSRDSQTNSAASQGNQDTSRDSQSSSAASQGSQGTSRDSQSNPAVSQSNQNTQRSNQSPAQTGADQLNSDGQSGMKHRGYMASAPANGMQLTEIMGAEVSTAQDEELGTVNELLVDQDGQLVAIVVGVGGFLGMAERDVAIGWGHVTQSRTDDNQLRVDVTSDELRAAPPFER